MTTMRPLRSPQRAGPRQRVPMRTRHYRTSAALFPWELMWRSVRAARPTLSDQRPRGGGCVGGSDAPKGSAWIWPRISGPLMIFSCFLLSPTPFFHCFMPFVAEEDFSDVDGSAGAGQGPKSSQSSGLTATLFVPIFSLPHLVQKLQTVSQFFRRVRARRCPAAVT